MAVGEYSGQKFPRREHLSPGNISGVLKSGVGPPPPKIEFPWRARDENFSSTRKFRRRENFGKKVWAIAIVFVKKSSKSELSSRFFGRLKILQDLEDHHETCEVPIWTSCEFLSVTTTFVSKSYPRCPKIQLSRIFGGGVKVLQTIFFLTFGPKLTYTFLVC